MKDSGRFSALRLFGRLFHRSTVRTVKEFFLTSVLCPVFLTNLEGKVGKVGKVGRVGKVGKVGKEGRLRE